MVSTGLTRARRSQAALALDPIPASKVQSDPLEIAELDKHNCKILFQVHARWLAHSTRCSKGCQEELGICRQCVGIFLFLACKWDAFKGAFQSWSG